MKILQVIISLRIGGAEKVIADIVHEYIKMGYQMDVLLFDGTDTLFKGYLQDKGITIYEFGKGGFVYNVLFVFKMIPFLRKYDVAHTIHITLLRNCFVLLVVCYAQLILYYQA